MPEPLPHRMRTSLRLRTLDARDRFAGRTDRLTPPRRLSFGQHADFAERGDEFLAHFVELGELQPHERVLDAGCGTGFVARPLTGYLSLDGRYEGFDVDRAAIGWCRRRYRRHPNFAFRVADRALREYRFPYDDDSFDFVVCASMLTHALEGDALHLIGEMARVLAPGGRLFATFFLLNDVSRAMIGEGRAGLEFLDFGERVAIVDEARPEEAVAYDEEWVFEALRAQGLVLTSIHPGSWCGREEHVSFQDIVVADA